MRSIARQIAICPLGGTDVVQIQGPVSSESNIDIAAEGLFAMMVDRIDVTIF